MGNSLSNMINVFFIVVDGLCFIVSLATQVYWNYSMGGGSGNPKSPGSRLGKWESQGGKQNAG